MVTVAVVLVLAGFAFKIAAVPFHGWAGDVYQGAPAPIAALLLRHLQGGGVRRVILILVAAPGRPGRHLGAADRDHRRADHDRGQPAGHAAAPCPALLAWSSVAQSGYILASARGQERGGGDASIAYLVFYAAMNLGAFAGGHAGVEALGAGELDDYRGLAFRTRRPGWRWPSSWSAWRDCPRGWPDFRQDRGVPGVVDGGGGWLAVVMAVNTVIGLYYYVAWMVRIFTPAPVPTSGVTDLTAGAGGGRTEWMPAARGDRGGRDRRGRVLGRPPARPRSPSGWRSHRRVNHPGERSTRPKTLYW